MPMYQAEAVWLSFKSSYPCAVKVATGKINALTGKPWDLGLRQDPQNYLTLPQQPWLDGYCVEEGIIRQFVAMPFGEGYSVEEQLSGEAEHGGIQFQLHPLKATVYFEKSVKSRFPQSLLNLLPLIIPALNTTPPSPTSDYIRPIAAAAPPCAPMGLAAGGRMRQEIYKDKRGIDEWDQKISSRCFVHLCDSRLWQKLTGERPPQPPFTARDYAKYKLPWYDYYRDDLETLSGSDVFSAIKSVAQIFRKKKGQALPDDAPIQISTVIQYGKKRRPDEVIEWFE